jgi:thymidylate synthase (FAD)
MKALYSDHMGGDLSVVKAAKVSFADDETVQWFIDDIDAKELGCRSHSALIRYLANHHHWTPFAHTAITLRMSAPIPIRTQCFKHKQGFVENEESRRYIASKPEFFIPDHFRVKPEGSAKQGSAGIHPNSEKWRGFYATACKQAIGVYNVMIAEGICPEQARLVLPQGVMVHWYWTGSLAAFARFYTQRTDPHAQLEIQQLAKQVGDIIEPLYPVSWAALTRPNLPTNA